MKYNIEIKGIKYNVNILLVGAVRAYRSDWNNSRALGWLNNEVKKFICDVRRKG